MINNSLVSIIIPCYNYGHFLAETLENVLSQTYINWECIIIDDGSIDNTKEVVQKFLKRDEKFKYIYQNNKGTSAAKNTGLSHSKGKYIQFLDADDLLAPNKIELQANFLDENASVGLIYGDARYFEGHQPAKLSQSFNMKDVTRTPGVSGSNETILKILLLHNFIVISAPLIRKIVVDEVGYFDVTLTGCEDWEFWIKCALKGTYFQFDERPEVLTFIRVHPNSSSKNNLTMLTGELKVRSILLEIPNIPEGLVAVTKHAFLQTKENRAYTLIKSGYLLKGFKDVFQLIFEKRSVKRLFMNSLYYLKVYLRGDK